jgi:hypothetical protein
MPISEQSSSIRVRSVRRIHLREPIPVYDVTVSGTDNFRLACGVYAHNSKDISDAMAAVAFTLTTYARRLYKPKIGATVF